MLVRVVRRGSDDSAGRIFSSDDYDIVILLDNDQKNLIRNMSEDDFKMVSGHSSDKVFNELLDSTGYLDAKCLKCGKAFLQAEETTKFCAQCSPLVKAKES